MRQHKLAVVGGVISAVVFTLCSPVPAQAELVYRLLFDQTEYLVAPGSTFDVQLIFREQASGADANHLTDTIGMTAADVRVGWTGGGSKVNAETDAVYGAGFAGIWKTLTATDIGLEQLAFDSGVIGADLGGGIREVTVGTLTFTAPNAVGDMTLVSFADHDPALSNLVIGFDDGNGTDTTFDVDDFGVTYGTMTITTVPEPGSIVLMSIAAVGMFSGYRLQRRRKQNAVAAPEVQQNN